MAPQMFKGLISHFLKNPSHSHRLPSSYSISLFSSTSSKHTSSNSSIKMFDYLLKEHNFSLEAAKRASSTVTHVKNPEQADSILSFFKQIGFSNTHIEDVVERFPKILHASLGNIIKPKISFFQDIGFTPADMAEFLSSDPWLLTRSANNRLGPSFTVLKNVLGSNAEVCRLLKLSGWYLKHDLEKTLLPNIEYLKSIGISSSQIVRYIFNFPRFFLLKPESIPVFVSRVDKMGFNRKSNMYLPAIRVISSMSVENWHLKLKLFQSLGFSENDILVVFRRLPQAFAVSTKKIQEVTELLLSVGKSDMSYVVKHPELLLCSVERRLIPRLQVIDVLEKKKLLQERPSLTSILKITDKQFLRRFVSPHSIQELNATIGRSRPIK